MGERYMADAISCGAFPGSVTIPGKGSQRLALRAGYINGSWPTFSECGTEVSIDVSGERPDADILDIETGDATPDTAPGWVRQHNAKGTGYFAVLYCNRSVIHAVADACDGAGLAPGRDFGWFIATLDGTTTVPDMTGVTAIQAYSANWFPENIDCSIVYDDAFKPGGVVPGPAPGVTGFDLPAGQYWGLLSGPDASHGGANAWEKAHVLLIQQALQQKGYAPTTPGWADGVFEQPTADAVAAWQHDHMPGTQFPGQVWADDWAALMAPPPPPPPSVGGLIGVKYHQTPGLADLLGPPVTPELPCPDGVGRFNHFANGGSIYWTPATGAFSVFGGIRETWAAGGWEKGPLGYPVSDEFGVDGYDSAGAPLSWRQSNFEHGAITWTDAGPLIRTR